MEGVITIVYCGKLWKNWERRWSGKRSWFRSQLLVEKVLTTTQRPF